MKNIGEILKDRGIITATQIEEAKNISKGDIAESLISLGYLTMDSLIEYLDYELKIKRDY